MRYTIEFIYADNDQIYLDYIECTREEAKQIEDFLDKMEGIGQIKSSGDGGPMVYPYGEPQFITFGELQSNWEDGLISTAKDHEITL